jgi:branched-subunit amino acid transport protein
MMTEQLWMLVLAMGLVTYGPRMLPMVFLNNMRLPPLLNAFLQYVPYAALGALIFPGIISSTGNIGSALAGGAVSAY